MTSTFLLHDDHAALRITVYLNHRGLPVNGPQPMRPHGPDDRTGPVSTSM